MDKERGITLVEVMITLAIITTVLVLALGVVTTTQRVYTETMISEELEQRGSFTVERLKAELSYAKIKTWSGYGTPGSISIDYRIPLQFLAGSIDFGYKGESSWYARIYFSTSDDKLIVAERDSTATAPSGYTLTRYNFQLNADSDLTDAFYVGRIYQSIYNASDVLQTSSTISEKALMNYSSPDGDIDGDGIADPLFQLLDKDGMQLTLITSSLKAIAVNTVHGRLNDKGTLYIMRRNSYKINMRNAQGS